MSQYRIMIVVEERTGDPCGDELVDYTETIGWTDDDEAMDKFIGLVRAQVETMPVVAGVTWVDPTWWTRDEFISILIVDRELSKKELKAKYGKDGEHPLFPQADWEVAVGESCENRRYWPWVMAKLARAE